MEERNDDSCPAPHVGSYPSVRDSTRQLTSMLRVMRQLQQLPVDEQRCRMEISRRALCVMSGMLESELHRLALLDADSIRKAKLRTLAASRLLLLRRAKKATTAADSLFSVGE